MARKQEVFGVDVNGDISGLAKAMKDAEQLMRTSARSLKKLNEAVKLNPTDDRLLQEQRDAYKKAIKENEEALKKLYDIRKRIVNDPNFKKGVTDMQEKFSELELEIQKTVTEQKKLKSEFNKLPSEAIAKVEDKFKKLGESVKKSKDALEKIKSSLKNVNQQIQLDPNNLDLYTKKTTLLNDELRVTEFAIANIKKRQDALQNSEGFFAGKDDLRKEWTENALLLEQFKKRAEELRRELDLNLSPSMQRFLKVTGNLGTKLQEVSKSTKTLSRVFSALGVASLKSAIDYESSIADIQRVVKDLSDDTISELKDIAIETGNAFKDISDYASIGGALGIAERDLSAFAKTMIDLNTATGGVFSGEEGAKGIAVFLKQLNLGIDQAENFGSAIAYIGDKYADIGDETVNVATRLTGLNSIIKTNQYELIGLSGVMADLGLASEANANGINRAFLQIDKIISGGVDNSVNKLEELAETSGMTSKEFKEAWGSDAVDTFLKFTDGLKSSVFNEINDAIDKSDDKIMKFADALGMSAEQFKKAWGKDSKKIFDEYVTALGEMDDESVVASKVLGDLGISSVNTAQTLLRLAGSGNEVREAIKLTEQAWKENTALTEKSNKIYETTASKLKGLWESLKQLGGALGDEVLPSLKSVTDDATKLAKSFSKLSPTLKSLVIKFIALASSVSPITGILGKVLDPNKGLPKLITLLAGPGGLVALLGLLTVAGVKAMSNIKTSVTSFRELSEEVKTMNDEFVKGLDIADKNYEIQKRSIDSAEGYAKAIDRVIEKLKDQTLKEEEQAELKLILRDYISKLNEALGDEIFYFDEATGKIVAQGEQIDKVSQKFDELSAKYKQEAWLETHKDTLNDAYQIIEESSGKMDSATEEYLKQMNAFPQAIRDAFESTAGTLDEAKQYLLDNGFADLIQNFDLSEASNIFQSYKDAIQETQTLVDNANSVIDSYMKVAEGNIAELDTNISLANESIQIMKEGVSETETSMVNIYDKRKAYASVLTEEQTTNDELLKTYDKQIEKLHTMQSYANEIENLYKKSNETVGQTIDRMESYTPSNKYVHFYAIYHGFGNEKIYAAEGGSRSGGFSGIRSYGYGELIRSALASANKTLSNMRSGGYRSGVTVNANFTVNSNNIGRNDVKNWSAWIIDDINEELGKRI